MCATIVRGPISLMYLSIHSSNIYFNLGVQWGRVEQKIHKTSQEDTNKKFAKYTKCNLKQKNPFKQIIAQEHFDGEKFYSHILNSNYPDLFKC